MENIKEKFIEWIKLKIEIHNSNNGIEYFKERQIWWASLGQNVGNEENGKNRNFERPVLILKKINNQNFWALPITSQVKERKYRYNFKRKNLEYSIKISQIRLLNYKRLLRLIGNISKDDFENIKEKIRKMI
jgi:mRNA interferase MazF